MTRDAVQVSVALMTSLPDWSTKPSTYTCIMQLSVLTTIKQVKGGTRLAELQV